MSEYPKEGDLAPVFSTKVIGGEYGKDENGVDFSLKDLQGNIVLLYFYPKDDTPGCTTQACSIRDRWDELKSKIKIFGISGDGIKSHIKFINKHELNFPLLSDEGHDISESYGVWKEKNMYGKKYFGIERTSFLIDSSGKIKAVFPKVKPAEHIDKVLSKL